MEEALSQSQTSFAAGQIVKGTIIEIRSKEIMVDIGYKSEGSVPTNEFEDLEEGPKILQCREVDSISRLLDRLHQSLNGPFQNLT